MQKVWSMGMLRIQNKEWFGRQEREYKKKEFDHGGRSEGIQQN